MKPSFEEFTKEIEIYEDTHVQLNIVYLDAWLLLGTLQLVLRHPDLPDATRQRMTVLTRDLEAVIAPTSFLRSVAGMGWEEIFDVTSK